MARATESEIRVFAVPARMLPPTASPVVTEEISASGKGLVTGQFQAGFQDEVLNESQRESEQTPALIDDQVSEISLVPSQKEPTATQAKEIPVTKKSYVQVAQKHTFTKQKFVVDVVDGKERVVVPKDVFVGAKPMWEDFVIGKFLSTKAPHVGKIHMIVNKIWRLGDRSTLIDVFAVNDTTVKFRIRNEGMRKRILNRGMWNLMDIPMVVTKWTPFAEEAQPALKSIQLWVTLNDVPPSMFTDKGLEFLFSAVGKPIRLHPKTEACSSFDEAQMLVEADLTKELPNEYMFTGEEEGELDVVVKYSYPWLPPKCSCCGKWGHLKDSCLVEKDSISKTHSNSGAKLNVETEPEIPCAVVVAEGIDTQVFEHHQSEEIINKGNEDVRKGDDKGWITPPKHQRSPGTKKQELKFGEVSLLSNAYSILSGKDESGEETSKEEVAGDVEGTNTTCFDSSQETDSIKPVEDSSQPIEFQLRQSLPRGSKTAHKVVSVPSSQSTRFIPKDQSKRKPHKNH